MTVMTKHDAIASAMSVAEDIAEGRLAPTDVEREAVAELRQLMLVTPEPGSDLEALQAESARRVLARGGIGYAEVSEWAAVLRRREAPNEPDAELVPPTPISSVSEAVEEPVAVDPDPVAEVEPQPPARAVAEPVPTPKLRVGDYDALAGWNAGSSRR